MRVKFIAPTRGATSYSEMARRLIYGLSKYTDWDVQVDVLSPNPKATMLSCDKPDVPPPPKADFGKMGEAVDKLVNQNKDYDVMICHFPVVKDYFNWYNPNKINIISTSFETNKLNEDWVEALNRTDAVFVPSRWNVELFKSTGVNVPVYYIPMGTDEEYTKDPEAKIEGVGKNDYVFYAIMQWIERKNPVGLLHAYLSTFSGREDVVLVMKTFIVENSLFDKINVESEFAEIRKQLFLDHYPRVILLTGKTMDTSQIEDLHKRGDCLVMPHRGEACGIPLFDAMAFGNPVITTEGTGNMDFMNPDNSLLLRAFSRPFFNMTRWAGTYNSTMNWLEPDIGQMQEYMWKVYSDRKFAEDLGKRAKDSIYENFHLKKTSKVLADAIQDISQKIKR